MGDHLAFFQYGKNIRTIRQICQLNRISKITRIEVFLNEAWHIAKAVCDLSCDCKKELCEYLGYFRYLYVIYECVCIYTSMSERFYAQNPKNNHAQIYWQSFNHHIWLRQCGTLNLEKPFLF